MGHEQSDFTGRIDAGLLVSLQGLQTPVFKNETDEHGNSNMVLVGVEPMSAGALKPEEYDQFVRDTANFLDYAGEPVKAKRQSWNLRDVVSACVLCVRLYVEERVLEGRPLTHQRRLPFVP